MVQDVHRWAGCPEPLSRLHLAVSFVLATTSKQSSFTHLQSIYTRQSHDPYDIQRQPRHASRCNLHLTIDVVDATPCQPTLAEKRHILFATYLRLAPLVRELTHHGDPSSNVSSFHVSDNLSLATTLWDELLPAEIHPRHCSRPFNHLKVDAGSSLTLKIPDSSSHEHFPPHTHPSSVSRKLPHHTSVAGTITSLRSTLILPHARTVSSLDGTPLLSQTKKLRLQRSTTP